MGNPQLRNGITDVVIYRLHTELRKVAEQAAKIWSGKKTKYTNIYVNKNS